VNFFSNWFIRCFCCGWSCMCCRRLGAPAALAATWRDQGNP
jgi:hypothetical protein